MKNHKCYIKSEKMLTGRKKCSLAILKLLTTKSIKRTLKNWWKNINNTGWLVLVSHQLVD